MNICAESRGLSGLPFLGTMVDGSHLCRDLEISAPALLSPTVRRIIETTHANDISD